MEKMQVVKEAFSRLVRPSDDEPRSMSQFPQLGVQEGGEGKTGSGAMQAGYGGTACSIPERRGDRNEPLGC